MDLIDAAKMRLERLSARYASLTNEKRRYVIAGVIVVVVSLIIIIALLMKSTFKSTDNLRFERCDRTNTTLDYLKVGSCSPGSPCKLKRGLVARFEIGFTPADNFRKAESRIILPDFGYAYDICSMGVDCPAVAGSKQSFIQEIEIYPEFPARETWLELSITTPTHDRLYHQILCAKFEVEIV